MFKEELDPPKKSNIDTQHDVFFKRISFQI